MTNDNDQALALDKFKLEAYKDLSRWNIHDEQSLSSRDKFLLTASVGACVASLMKYREVYHFVYLGSLVALCYWMILSIRYRLRIQLRIESMHGIEEELGYSPYSTVGRSVGSILWLLPRDLTLRTSFFFLFVLVMCPPILTQLGMLINCISRYF